MKTKKRDLLKRYIPLWSIAPLATSWQCNKFLNPINDGAVLPILHLNGYKISNPTIFSRISHEEVENFFKGCGWKPYFVEGDDPMTMHRKMAETMDSCIEEIKAIQKNHFYCDASKEAKHFGDKLISLHEKSIQDLKKYL